MKLFFTEIEEMSEEVMDAKEKEINNLRENNVFEAVDDVGQRRVSTKWIFTHCGKHAIIRNIKVSRIFPMIQDYFLI